MRLLQARLSNVPGLQWNWTAGSAKQEPTFRAILEQSRPTRTLEIGTHQGVSTALLAEYAPVITVDVLPNGVRRQVWERMGVSERITEQVHKSSRGRDEAITEAAKSCDLAFIDGSHLMPDVVRDFELCRPAGRIVLHDYWRSGEDWPDVREFVDLLDREEWRVTIRPPFAVVEALS